MSTKNMTSVLPAALVITDGAMATDGGSLVLNARDQSGREIDLRLDWSIAAQQQGTTQLYAASRAVLRGSAEEAHWLALIYGAAVEYGGASTEQERRTLSEHRLILADDAAEYSSAIEQGPFQALSALAERLVSVVPSEAYQNCRPPAVGDSIRSLLMQGRKTEAIRAYRERHPGIGIQAAKAAVEEMAAKTGQSETVLYREANSDASC